MVAALLIQLAPAPAPQVVTPALGDFDLATLERKAPRCGSGVPGDIVVCARPSDLLLDLAKLAPIFEPRDFRPETSVLGGTARARVEQRETLSGSAPAVMFDFLRKF